MTEKQAYAAMFFFLKDRYERSPSDELGILLGSLSLLPDGSPADPAVLDDWKKAVDCAMLKEADHLILR